VNAARHRNAPGQRSSAWPLALAAIALIVYASLYPFSGWRWPESLALSDALRLPWMARFSDFDEWSNLLGYVPLAALLYLAHVRSGGRVLAAMVLAVLLPVALSYLMELTQLLVPRRVPSLRDWAWNSAGAVLGALLGLLVQASGALARWQALRDRWFHADAGLALAGAALWPLALLFPAPLPFGLGQMGEALLEGARGLLQGTPMADVLAPYLATDTTSGALTPAREVLGITLGLLAPVLLLYAAALPGWHRPLIGAAVLGAGFAGATMSAALNFSPQHALAWVTPHVLPAFAAAACVAVLALGTGRRLAAAFGLVAVTAMVIVVSEAPSDPYFAASLNGWEQGRFVRFHGLAQWLGWLWPYAAAVWFITVLTRRPTR
jgi:VanZ family protein